MRHEIYCQKNGVQEHNGAEYFIFLECCPPKNDWLILTLQSFPRIGVLNVKCPCFPPLLWAGQAVTSYTSHGKITQAHTLQMLLCSSGVFFCSNYRGGWEALRCKGLWGVPPHFSPEVQNLENWGVNVPLGQISCGGATRVSEHSGFGAAGRTAALQSWFSAQ